jgi:hypothetical protein
LRAALRHRVRRPLYKFMKIDGCQGDCFLKHARKPYDGSGPNGTALEIWICDWRRS